MKTSILPGVFDVEVGFVRIAVFGGGRRNGPAVWRAGVFAFSAKSAIRMQLLVLWSGGPLIAKAI